MYRLDGTNHGDGTVGPWYGFGRMVQCMMTSHDACIGMRHLRGGTLTDLDMRGRGRTWERKCVVRYHEALQHIPQVLGFRICVKW
jgi:hypothetical protein